MTIERILNRLEKLELASLPNIRKGDRIIVNSESTKNPEIWVGTVHRVKRDKSLFRCIFDDDFWMDMPITNSGTGLLGFASTLRKRKSPIPMEGIASWVDQDKWMANWLRKQIPVEDKIPKPTKSAKPVPQSKAKIIAMKMSSVLTRKGHNSSIEPKKWFYTSGKPSVVDTLKSLCKMFDLKLKKSKETAPPTNYSMGEYQIYDVYEGNEFMFHLSIGVVNPVVDKSKPDGGRNNKVQSANRHPDSSTQTTPIVAKVIHNLASELTYKASRVTRGFQTLEVWAKNKKQLDSMITFFKEHNYYLSNNGNSQFIGLYNKVNGQPGDHLATLVIYINDLPVLDSTKIMRLPKFGSDREVDVVKTLANLKKVLPKALFRSNILGNEVILDRTQPQYSTAKQLFGSFKRFCQDYQISCEVVDDYQMEIKLGGKKMGVRLGPVPDSGKYIKGGEEDTVKEKDKNDKVI